MLRPIWAVLGQRETDWRRLESALGGTLDVLEWLRESRAIEHATVLNHDRDAPRIADVRKRIRVEQDEVRNFSLRDGSEGIERAEEFGRVVGGATESFQRCEP